MSLNSGLGFKPFLSNTKNNLLLNGGFEYGPAFPSNSTGGILVNAESNLTQSPIYQWEILGTVKYVINNNYTVPQGDAAIELVSGKSSGIQTTVTLKKGSKYDMETFVGHYNELCIGELAVRIKAGSDEFYRPIGKAENYQRINEVYTITVDSSVTSISIQSEATTKTKDGVLCGPATDRIVLLPYSYGLKLQTSVLFVCPASILVSFMQLIG
ncbi:uncharacterized protein LOC113345005 [Papaver somniferum]|uniref:uncharacterized protein LOC113345005 n=1 Tax=Papaver somniferum TaxID=3469 RepID=UPI000E6F91D3|nr:uncharacterized protein LOC113345005 [Papaver somniferum]